MGQKGSKEWTNGDNDSTLVESLVNEQIARDGAEVVEENQKSAKKKKKNSKKVAIQKDNGESDSEVKTPVPKVQGLFDQGQSEDAESNEKSKKKAKVKKSDSKRQAPKRRRSTRVAPCVTSSPKADATSENEASATTGAGLFDGHVITKNVTGEICVEVDDEMNESMESETESLSMRSPSHTESLKEDNGAGAVTKVTIGGAVIKEQESKARRKAKHKMAAPEETLDDTFMTALQLFNSMNDGQLSPYLFDPSYLLIIDVREEELYKESHIVTAFHFSDLLNPDKFGDLKEYTIILLYDSNGLTYSLTDSAISNIMNELTDRKLDPTILKGGYDNFSEIYPFLCTDKIVQSGRERAEELVQYPSEILPQQLYLGRGEQATNERIINDLDLTHIVNISTEHKDAFTDRLEYLTLKLTDESSTNLFKRFQDVIKFVGDAAIGGGRILVHCNLGQSRSATVVIAYLMATKGWNLKDAFFYVKERRPNISPNRGFFQQLSKYEEEIVGANISDPHELWMK